jgi:hypothetical protein
VVETVKLYVKAVDREAEHSKYTAPNIWLSEQGVVFFIEKHPKAAWIHDGVGPEILNAYVEHGATQLTRANGQINRFFYCESRGDPGFDSGLPEPEEYPASVKHRKPTPDRPRHIYRIYAKKTPGGYHS